jgi:hypothetical protein
MTTVPQPGEVMAGVSTGELAPILAFYSIADLAARWGCSRGTVYYIIRGEKVFDFAAPDRRGKKLA